MDEGFLHMSSHARRIALIVAILVSFLVPTPAGAAVVDEQALIVSAAQQQLGKPFRLGSNGPTRFDCSGLVYYVYAQAGLQDRIGGKRYVADEFYRWGRDRGLVSTDNPRVGDLVLWKPHSAAKIKHMGIYIGEVVKIKGTVKANGKKIMKNKVTPIAISALTSGVARHKMNTISMPFFAYVHIGLGLRDDNPTPTHANTDADADADAHSDSDTDADADAHSDSDADADAGRHANANPARQPDRRSERTGVA